VSEICILCSETVNGAVKHKRVSDTPRGLGHKRGYRTKGLESTYSREGKLIGRNRMLQTFGKIFFGFSIWIFL